MHLQSNQMQVTVLCIALHSGWEMALGCTLYCISDSNCSFSSSKLKNITNVCTTVEQSNSHFKCVYLSAPMTISDTINILYHISVNILPCICKYILRCISKYPLICICKYCLLCICKYPLVLSLTSTIIMSLTLSLDTFFT